jgi:hypothetical protein
MKIFAKERMLAPSWDLLRPSFELVRKNIWHVVYLSFAPALLVSVGVVLLGDLSETEPTLNTAETAGTLILISAVIWSLLVFPGFTYLQTQAARGRQLGVWESFKKGLPHLGSLIGAGLLSVFIVAVGLILLIIPGLIAIRGLFLVPYYIVDQDMGPVEAIKKSFKESEPVSAWIWGTIGVVFAFGFMGTVLGYIPILGYFLSILVSYPYIFAPALRYAEIEHKLKIKTS